MATPTVELPRSTRPEKLAWIGLALVTALAIALRFALFARVPPNPFYDAAVRSMGLSWKGFFYGSYEPASQLSIDKAPLDLWFQVASTKLFGFNSTALRLPEAIAGTLAVPLLFDAVRRMFNSAAGLASALVLAMMPICVITARSDTMDSMMMFFMVASLWFVVRAGQTQKFRFFVGCGVALGLAFEVKGFESLAVLPALVVFAAVANPLPWRDFWWRALTTAGSFVAAALAWPVVASILPGNHPWAFGSTNGSVWSALFDYNGLGRLTVHPSAALESRDPSGPLRLFSSTTGAIGDKIAHDGTDAFMIGTTLVAALIIGAIALAFALPRLRRGSGPDLRFERASVASVATWLIVGLILFSQMTRLHSRYLEAMTPAVAAALGVGLASLVILARSRWNVGLVLVAAGAVSLVIADAIGATGGLAVIAGGAAVIVALIGALLMPGSPLAKGSQNKNVATALLAAGTLAAVLAIPSAGSVMIVTNASFNSGRPGVMGPSNLEGLSAYLRAHQGSAKYEAASPSVMKTGSLIARDGRPILFLTSLNGQPLLTPAELEAKVKAGEVKYVLFDQRTCRVRWRQKCTPVVRWALDHSTPVVAADASSTRALSETHDAGGIFRFTDAPK